MTIDTSILLTDCSFALLYFCMAYPDLTEGMYVVSPPIPDFFEEAWQNLISQHVLQVGGAYDAAVLMAQAYANTYCSADANNFCYGNLFQKNT